VSHSRKAWRRLEITWHDGAVYIVLNNRDSLDTLWPSLFSTQENAERAAELMNRGVQGSNFGRPFCFYDYGQKKLLLNPEYGGDGKTVAVAANSRCRSRRFPRIGLPSM
jgi:hypothetical protein